MRGKRAKQYRKLMKQYAQTFGFREPYQVLVDAQMIQDTHRFSMRLQPALERTLSGEVKPMITQCSIRHLYLLPASEPLKEAFIEVAKQCERRRCNHHTLAEPLSTMECLKSVIDPKSTTTDRDLVNKFNYVVAVQDEDVRRWCRSVKGIPLIFVKRSVMVMEPMTETSERIRNGVEKGKFRVGIRGRVSVTESNKRKRSEDHDATGQDEMKTPNPIAKRTKKGPKGPNPLSVKKPKKLIATAKTKTNTTAPNHNPESTMHSTGADHGPIMEHDHTDKENLASIDARPKSLKMASDVPAIRRRKRKHKSSIGQEISSNVEMHDETNEP